MAQDWLKIEAYFARPGSERTIADCGTKALAHLDTGAEATIVNPHLVNLVYGESGPQYSSRVTVATAAGQTEMLLVPLLVGLRVGAQGLIRAQVNCLLWEQDNIILGNDILSLLGIEIRVDYQEKRLHLERYTWERFEDEVAALYRELGANVKQNVNLGGFQIDMVVHEVTQSGQYLRLLVECKFYKDRVGNRVVNDFARVVDTLKLSNAIDRGVIISHRGFTQDASLVADNTKIELLTLADLRQRLPATTAPASPAPPPPEEVPAESIATTRQFFVLMPFTPELGDVYHLGIREAVGAVGGACERADEIQDTGGIIEKIYDSIREADVIIAEVSLPNPNVYYEVGFAHALGKPVILLTRDISGAPFDLRGYHHIVYASIRELRTRLQGMFEQLLD